MDYEAYAAVRGMPKREAAEDFYLLNKIAKQGPVVRPRLDPIRIAQRTSTRVPFGTGAATGKISNQLREGTEFCMYCPESFSLLRDLLEALEDGISKGELELSSGLEDTAQSLGLVQAFALARDQTKSAECHASPHRRVVRRLSHPQIRARLTGPKYASHSVATGGRESTLSARLRWLGADRSATAAVF